MICDLSLIRVGTARRSRKGLTLLELVVVMGVLVAIAGLLVPLLPNLIATANNATGAVNVAELTKELQTYQAVNSQKYPDGYDSLVDGSNAIPPQVLLSTWFSGMGASDLNVTTLSTSEATSLSLAGITTVYNLVSASGGTTGVSATFPGVATTTAMGVTTPTATLLSSSPTVVKVQPAYIQQVFGEGASPGIGDPNTYVAFGVGAYSTIVGAPMAEWQKRRCEAALAETMIRARPTAGSSPSIGSTPRATTPPRWSAALVPARWGSWQAMECRTSTTAPTTSNSLPYDAGSG